TIVWAESESRNVSLTGFIVSVGFAVGKETVNAPLFAGGDVKRPVRGRLYAPDVLGGRMPDFSSLPGLDAVQAAVRRSTRKEHAFGIDAYGTDFGLFGGPRKR